MVWPSLGNSNEPANPKTLNEIELAAGPLGVQIQSLDVLSPKHIETAFRAATKARADALVVLRTDPPGRSHLDAGTKAVNATALF